jgi:hypothetical protein
LTFSLSHTINSYSSFSLNVNASLQQSASESGGTDRQTLSVAPTYNRQLTSKWNSSIGYLFRYSDSGTSKAKSNKIFFSVSRGIDIVPWGP